MPYYPAAPCMIGNMSCGGMTALIVFVVVLLAVLLYYVIFIHREKRKRYMHEMVVKTIVSGGEDCLEEGAPKSEYQRY